MGGGLRPPTGRNTLRQKRTRFVVSVRCALIPAGLYFYRIGEINSHDPNHNRVNLTVLRTLFKFVSHQAFVHNVPKNVPRCQFNNQSSAHIPNRECAMSARMIRWAFCSDDFLNCSFRTVHYPENFRPYSESWPTDVRSDNSL